jgi:hypothetical protein
MNLLQRACVYNAGVDIGVETNSDSWVKVNVDNWYWWPGLPYGKSDHYNGGSCFEIWDTRYSSEGTE